MRLSYISWIRQAVGSQKIFLVMATVIVTDGNGRVLVQRRTDFDFWGFPGGAMELGESIEQTAQREVREETGLEVGALTLVGVHTDPKFSVTYPNGDQVQQFNVLFTTRVAGGKMQPDGVETSDQLFIPVETAHRYSLPVWYQAMLADYLSGRWPTFCPPAVRPPIREQFPPLRAGLGHQRIIAAGGTAVIRNSAGQVLLIQDPDDGTWQLPGGYVKLGENVAYAVQRVVQHITGQPAQIERILGIYSGVAFQKALANGDQVQDVGVVFAVSLVNQPLLLPASAWVDPPALPARLDERDRPLALKIVEQLDQGIFIL